MKEVLERLFHDYNKFAVGSTDEDNAHFQFPVIRVIFVQNFREVVQSVMLSALIAIMANNGYCIVVKAKVALISLFPIMTAAIQNSNGQRKYGELVLMHIVPFFCELLLQYSLTTFEGKK